MKNENENDNIINIQNSIENNLLENQPFPKKKEFTFSGIFIPLILGSIGLLFIILFLIFSLFSNKKEKNNNNWFPQGDHIKTIYAEKIDVNNVLPEYPRPNFQRDDWINLNGLWEFVVINMSTQYGIKFDKKNKENYLNSIKNIKIKIPKDFNKTKILVPFPIESSLSGIQRNLSYDEELWYKREIKIPKKYKNKRILLNFQAVDWNCTVFINNKIIGTHIGGYSPFSFDITDHFKDSDKQTIYVRVIDPTDFNYQPTGKQRINSTSAIFYTQSSGIWQTVWMEFVDKLYIKNYKITPDVDRNGIKLNVSTSSELNTNGIIVRIYSNNEDILQTVIYDCDETETLIGIPNNKIYLWSPDDPFLYNIEIKLFKGHNTEKIYDRVTGYFALRKIAKIRDDKLHYRIQLNNKFIFSLGPLDQGFWPDGLYTPPSDEAIKNEIKNIKELGFNSIRKHIKIEPARWYYYCDKMGIMVWQDIPSGEIGKNVWDPSDYNKGTDVNRTKESKDDFYFELDGIVNSLFNYPSIIMWVPFNEAMGQFESEKVTEYIYNNLDNSRLINSASGGNHRYTGDFLDIHSYPSPKKKLFNVNYINVIGEYGGIGLYMEKNTWGNCSFSYIIKNSTEEVTIEYENYAETLINLINEGFSAGIYTQLTDVECEVNGLFSYDRKEYKVIKDRIRAINKKIINSLK